MRGAWPAALGAALGALLSLRTVVAFTELPWFDVDPALSAVRFPGLGPSGSLLLDAGIAAVSAVLVAAFAGRAAVMVAIGSLAVVVARLGDESTLGALGWRGADWIAAWCACAGAVAVARNPRQPARLAWSTMVAVMLGACCLWLARGAWQWFHEHASTVDYFRTQAREAFFGDRGWDPQGPQALTYERRLLQREMGGWFALANVFSGVMAVAAVALAGLPRVAGRRGVSWGMLSGACAAAVLANGSKGAIAAMAIGFGALLALRLLRVRAPIAAASALALVGLSSAAAWLRAGPLAGAWPDERSLLFRSHYLETARRAWLEQPWTGTGPDGFQDASARLRPVEAVEIVRSAHAAFVDWVAQLGVGGFAWMLAALGILAWSAHGAASEREPLPAPESRDGAPQRCAMAAALAAMLASILIEADGLDAAGALVRFVGGAAWAGAAVTLLPRLWSARGSGARMLFPAALVTLCHAQVEMTLWNPGSAAWLLALLGASVPPHAVAADAAASRASPRGWPRAIGAIACTLVAGACLLRSSREARTEHALEEAAERLHARVRASGVSPQEARREAAAALRTWSRLLACEQWMRAAEAEGAASDAGRRDLAAAAAAADDAVRDGAGLIPASRLDALHAAAQAWERLALAGDSTARAGAFERALEVTRFDAGSASGWLRAARIAATLERPDAAALASEALRRDDAMELDPLVRLSPSDRELAERLAGVTFPKPSAPP